MKQFLILALLTLTVLGGFYLVRGGDSDKQPGPGPVAGGPAAKAPKAPQAGPTTRRPNVPKKSNAAGDGTVATKEGRATTVLSPAARAALEAERAFNWDDAVSEEFVVKMEDAWQVDLTGIDWDADVLCVVNGMPITRDRFMQQVVLEKGYPLVRSQFFEFAGQRIAAQYGMPYGLTDAQYDLYLREWARSKGSTYEDAVQWISLTSKLPVEAALLARRQMLESILAFFPHREEVSELPVELLAVLRNESVKADAMQVVSAMAETREGMDTPEGMRNFVQVIEPMISMWSLGVGTQELFRRTWTFLDAPETLPANAMAGYFTGPLDEVDVQPPWTLTGGEFRYVETQPIWDLIQPMISPFHREQHLRQLLWSVVLRRELADLGGLPSPEKAWKTYALEYLKGQNALLSVDFTALAINGYPTLSHYREAEMVMAAFRRTRPAGWDSEENLRQFFGENRMFVQSWAPDVDVAFFPPRDFEKPVVGDPDWAFAEARAREFQGRVLAGEDFGELCVAQNDETARRLESALGAVEAQDFRETFRSGHLQGGINEIRETLRESRYLQVQNCASVVHNMVARLRANDISEPWRAQIGYLVVRMNRVRLSGLEDDFEDLVEQTRSAFYDAHFFLWANGVLSSIEVE